MTNPIVRPVILSGGSGTRLWPLSRSAKPKQLLSLTSVETMLQLTARRTSQAAGFAAPYVVASAAHADMIEEQLDTAGIPLDLLILEPVGRNTAAAIALAALAAGPDELLLVMPSDHVIEDVPGFVAAIATAAPVAQDGWLVTFGITADAPETGYGYIHRGDAIAPGVHRVARFVEKPDRATAERFVASGEHSWNGGIFLFSAAAMLTALRTHAPAILDAVAASIADGARDGGRLRPDPALFAACPSDSIDYAVLERADRVAVVPVSMGWSDVGSWDALHAIAARDATGCAVHGEVIAIDTSDCLFRTDGPLIAAVGVKDLIVVATGDAILILPRGSSQDVKRIVEELKAANHPSLHTHRGG